MAVVQVRIVRVGLHQRFVLVDMGMRFAAVITLWVRMLMVLVVPMGMAVDQPFVTMKMLMPLCDLQPYGRPPPSH